MNKCLITKLKATVDNPDLPIFGGVKMSLTKNTSGSIKTTGGSAKLIFSDGSYVEISENKDFLLSGLENEGVTNVTWVSNYDAFPRKGSTDYFTGVAFDIGEFAYIDPTKLTEIFFETGGVYGDLNKLPNTDSLITINFNGNSCKGTLGQIISKWPNICKNSSILNTYNNYSITGNVSELAALKHLPSKLFIGQNCVGNLYDAIVGWRVNISETGVIERMLCGNNVSLFDTFPGVANGFGLSWTKTTASITMGGVTTTYNNSGEVVV